jgi:hypothetical protein
VIGELVSTMIPMLREKTGSGNRKFSIPVFSVPEKRPAALRVSFRI